MLKNIKKITIIIFLFTVLLVPYTSIFASGEIVPGSDANKPSNKYKTGNYTLDDIILIAGNVATWILGIIGSLALLMFIYGGFVFIFSGGSQEKVTQGKQILINAVIGLVIVFSSYLIIQFTMKIMGITTWKGEFLSF